LKAPQALLLPFWRYRLLLLTETGARLNYKYTHDNPANHYFSCRNNRQNNGLCLTTHHIRVDKITEIVTNYLRSLINFACQYEDDCAKRCA